jgi:hypothetical protein
VFGLFLGDPDGKATLEIDGRQEAMTATRATVDELAAATGGVCVNASTDDADVQALVARIQTTVTQRPWESRALVAASERYHYPLVPGFILVAAGALLPTRRRSRIGAAGMPLRMAS